jgi:nitrite reductase/ring-hydroxylating ferredoxin subunit
MSTDTPEAPPLPVGLPMPHNPALLDPSTTRVRVRTRTDRFPFPLPNGWFVVAEAAEVDPGQIVARHYFDNDIVVWRGADGTPHTYEAYCPHLGAHLAVGGTVQDDTLVCPFHGWRFDGEAGSCIEIPYAQTERIPARAQARTYPTVERNGMIWAWHHTEEGEPFFDVPVVAEFGDPDWLEPTTIDFHISTSCQEMAENNHDFAHFKYVHGYEFIPDGEEFIEGTYKRVEGAGLIRETFGLGLGVLHIPGAMAFLSSVTPVDTDNVHVRWTFCAPKSAGAEGSKALAEGFSSGVSQDIPIWENKIYRDRPVLTKGEAGIAMHRKWSEQFYS